MGTQVCFTADEPQVAVIDEIAANTNHSRSDVVATLVWLAITNLRAHPRDYGDLLQTSAGTGASMPSKVAEPAEPLTDEDQAKLKELQAQWKARLEINYAQGARHNTVQYLIGKSQRLFYIISELGSSPRKKVKLSFGAAYSEMGEEWSKDFLCLDESILPVRLHVQWQSSSGGTSIDASVEQVDPKAYDLDGDKAILLIKRVIGGEV